MFTRGRFTSGTNIGYTYYYKINVYCYLYLFYEFIYDKHQKWSDKLYSNSLNWKITSNIEMTDVNSKPNWLYTVMMTIIRMVKFKKKSVLVFYNNK